MLVEPVALTGQRWVNLEPLGREHLPQIDAVAADGELGGLWFTGAPKAGSTAHWVDARLAVQSPSTGLTFVVRDTGLGRPHDFENVSASRRITWRLAEVQTGTDC